MWVSSFRLPGITTNKQFSAFLEISGKHPTIWSTPPCPRPLSDFYMLLPHSFFSVSNVHFYTGHKHILGFWRCVSTQPITVCSCCASQPMTVQWGVEPASMSDSASCLSLYHFSFFYHLPLSLSFSRSPSLLIYYSNEAEVRIWHK